MSKANARDWHDEQRKAERAAEELINQSELLRYAGEKRDNMPCPITIEALGFPDVARKVRQAIGLLSNAYDQLQEERP